MGLTVVPLRFETLNGDTGKRTLEVNFAPCSIVAYAMLSGFYGDGWAFVGLKRVRQRRADGSERRINLGNGEFAWPKCWSGDNISSVTFAASLDEDMVLDAVCVIHTS